jgi:hypothetical protein
MDLCCSHNPSRSLSPPLEPARRVNPMSLDGIFALAALPGDHPHAVKGVGSPGFGERLRRVNAGLGLRRRRTMKGLEKELDGGFDKGFDEDARGLESEEVLERVGLGMGSGVGRPRLRLRTS